MNVLEQTRGLGLLRIIGLDRAGLRRMVAGQAALIGLFGMVPGVIAGLLVPTPSISGRTSCSATRRRARCMRPRSPGV